MKVYIDIGHGENGDPGAVNAELIEHEMAKVTGGAMAEKLRARGFEVKVEPGNLGITESARLANSWGADILISAHYNAGGGRRGEVIYSWDAGSIPLAEAAAEGMKKAGQETVRIYKSKANSTLTAEFFGILRAAKMPAIIIEPAFIDNLLDRKLVDTPMKQRKMGECIADGIADFYGGEEEKVIYKTIEEVPDWGRKLIRKLVDRKSLQGSAPGNLNLSEDLLRTLVVLEREGVIK